MRKKTANFVNLPWKKLRISSIGIIGKSRISPICRRGEMANFVFVIYQEKIASFVGKIQILPLNEKKFNRKITRKITQI